MRLSKMRIGTLALAACLVLLAFTFTFALPSSALAWDNCPKGLVNDPYPGACRRYVDTNGDGICDLSQSEPVEATTTTTEVVKEEEQATTTTPAVATTTSGEPPTGDCPLGPCANCGACLGISSIVSASTDSVIADQNADEALAVGAVALAAADTSATTSTTTPSSGSSVGTDDARSSGPRRSRSSPLLFTHYLVSPIAIGFFLDLCGQLRAPQDQAHPDGDPPQGLERPSGGYLPHHGHLRADPDHPARLQLPFTIPIDLLFWHVEAGMAMTLISLFHMGWHFNYYRNLVRRSRRRCGRPGRRRRCATPRNADWPGKHALSGGAKASPTAARRRL